MLRFIVSYLTVSRAGYSVVRILGGRHHSVTDVSKTAWVGWEYRAKNEQMRHLPLNVDGHILNVNGVENLCCS